MSRTKIISFVTAVCIAATLAATALALPQDKRNGQTAQAGYTKAALRAMGERWEAYAAHFAGPPRASASRSDYTPAALRALGARWEAYAAFHRARQER